MSEQEVDVLKRQMKSLRKEFRQWQEQVDTVAMSPLYKRIWWALCGYRFRRVGRWRGKTEDLK